MHLRFNSNICLFLAVLFGGFLACKSRISTNALVKESDPTDVDYVTGIVKVIEGGKPVIMVGKKRSVVLLNSDVKLEVGQRIHVVGRYEVSDEFESSDEDEQIGRINVHQLIILKPQSEQRFPSALKYSMSILGELPFSRRTLLFAKVYDDMSKGLDTYLGAPRTLTSFHFEPHVMYDLHLYLVKLENAKKAFDRIQQKTGNVNVLAEEALSAFSSQSLIKPIVRLCLIDIDDTKVANIPIIAALMVKNIGTCQKNIERLYDSLTSLNLYLFRHNAGFDLSPYIAYFKAASASPYFNGRAKFPDDQNSILQEAFYRLYIAANEVDQTKRIRLVEEFNQLLIGHEQILAQPYFDQVKDVHERLKGLVSVNDPVGTYPLSQDSWAQLNVRMSLNTTKDSLLSSLNSGDLLHHTNSPGSISHYYKSRIVHPQFAKMFGGKQFLEGISVVETGLDKDLTGEELIRKNGCNGCHAIRGFSEANEMVGPSLLNLAARLNREQIRQSIVNPEGVLAVNVLTKKPYASGVMPRSFAVDLSESELDRMIDYLMVK